MSSSVNFFENIYQNLKQKNKDGWNTERISQSMFKMASNILQRDNICRGSLLDLPYEPIKRCKIENGVFTRYMGLPQNIVIEIKNEGFNILDYQVFSYEQDLLVVNAQKLL